MQNELRSLACLLEQLPINHKTPLVIRMCLDSMRSTEAQSVQGKMNAQTLFCRSAATLPRGDDAGTGSCRQHKVAREKKMIPQCHKLAGVSVQRFLVGCVDGVTKLSHCKEKERLRAREPVTTVQQRRRSPQMSCVPVLQCLARYYLLLHDARTRLKAAGASSSRLDSSSPKTPGAVQRGLEEEHRP